jgi:hypothetical protein
MCQKQSGPFFFGLDVFFGVAISFFLSFKIKLGKIIYVRLQRLCFAPFASQSRTLLSMGRGWSCRACIVKKAFRYFRP